MTNKIKILTLSDHPLSPSGVGTQTRYMIEHLLQTGKYKFVSLGGAIKHVDYTPTKTEEFGEDWVIYPIDGYGTHDIIRSFMRTEQPDIVWFMTDPRFWGWLWEIDNEIRALAPMVYYHVWDNYPYPLFNKPFYDSNDYVAAISKVTADIVKTVSPSVRSSYLPHAVNTEIFKRIEDRQVVTDFAKQSIPAGFGNEDRVTFFWNNRNARRKQSGSLIYWFKDFLDEVGHDNARLIMHTDPKDPNGQDLEHIVNLLDLGNGQVFISKDKVPPELLSMMYNMADCTINISDAEGFGLATLESLACETPVIVNMTGGLQEQVTDGEEWFGVGIEPASKAIIGSQDIPYIYEDRLNGADVVAALKKIYNMTTEERQTLGQLGRGHVMKNYNFGTFCTNWDNLLTDIHEQCGSWETRKNYKSWEMQEVI